MFFLRFRARKNKYLAMRRIYLSRFSIWLHLHQTWFLLFRHFTVVEVKTIQPGVRPGQRGDGHPAEVRTDEAQVPQPRPCPPRGRHDGEDHLLAEAAVVEAEFCDGDHHLCHVADTDVGEILSGQL